jgi:hypothetical protein
MVSRRNVVRSAFVAALIAAVGGFVLIFLEMCHQINELFWRVAFRLSGDVVMVGDFTRLVCGVGWVSFVVGGLFPLAVLGFDALDRRRVK